MNNMKTTLALILSLVALVMASLLMMNAPEGAAEKTSTYDRIMKTRTIRCAYQAWPPFLTKDPNTGKISGVYADLFEQIGKDLNQKVDWAEEVGTSNMFEGLSAGRYDMVCSPITMTPQRATVSYFTRPIGFVPFYLYVREGDTRFDHKYDAVDNENVSLMFIDGDYGGMIETEVFPKAKKIGLPNLTNGTDLLVGVVGMKADATVNDPTISDVFMKNNPGKIRRAAGPPLRFPSIGIALPLGEDKLLELMNQTITNYLEVGKIDRILNIYGLDETKILRVAVPYHTQDVQREVDKP